MVEPASRKGRARFPRSFKDQIVERDEYLLALSRYVGINPVRANLVQRPEDWVWSSYRATIGACQVPSFLATSKTLNLLGVGTDIELQTRFRRFATACTEDPAAVDRFRSNEHIIGTNAFKQRVESAQSADVHV